MAEAKQGVETVKVKAKNVTEGRQQINALPPVVVNPGEVVEVEMSKAEHDSAKHFGVFEFGAKAVADKD